MPNTIVIKKQYIKKIKDGYPWVFLDYVTSPSIIAISKPGELIDAIDLKGHHLGTGYVEPNSKICIRMFGPSLINKFDDEFFHKQVLKALQKREKATKSKFYRLINSEGDFLPGLTIDRFNDTLSCQITTQGMCAYEDIIIKVLEDIFLPKSMIFRTPNTKVPIIIGQPINEVIVKEYGIKYCANLMQGQKTGWYFDQRENRHLIAELCKGKGVLDAFCYNGGFGIAAAVNGAESVTFIDSSKLALESAKKSLGINAHHTRAEFIQGDAFDELANLKEKSFDVAIVDPPPFIPSKAHKTSGLKGYFKLALASITKIRLGGLLFFASCSHHVSSKELQSLVLKAVKDSGRNGKILKILGHTFDHPTHPKLPESKYLNALLIEVG